MVHTTRVADKIKEYFNDLINTIVQTLHSHSEYGSRLFFLNGGRTLRGDMGIDSGCCGAVGRRSNFDGILLFDCDFIWRSRRIWTLPVECLQKCNSIVYANRNDLTSARNIVIKNVELRAVGIKYGESMPVIAFLFSFFF